MGEKHLQEVMCFFKHTSKETSCAVVVVKWQIPECIGEVKGGPS